MLEDYKEILDVKSREIQEKMDELSTTWAAHSFAKGWEELKPNIKSLKLLYSDNL